MMDMAHVAGLVAAGLHPDPVPYCDIVTTTTHKTLRAARGGMILCRQKYAKKIDRSVFPGTQGGPLMHMIAGKAVGFGEVLRPEFKEYQQRVLDNAQTLSRTLQEEGIRVVWWIWAAWARTVLAMRSRARLWKLRWMSLGSIAIRT